ncbi:MAG: phosphoglycerate kinase [Candidatus Woesearchaeota archaeon]|nr:MAG: phosphoglycerate kinase [Candidatus Woesearchaeota archaeon]
MKLKTLDDVNLKDKRVLVRVDINNPVEKGKVQISPRLIEHAKTIKELSRKKAKVCIIAHQGRPGRDDFIDLNQHAKLLTKVLKIKVKYIDDLYGNKAITEINRLNSGEIILLKNLRTCKDELAKVSPAIHAKSKLVTTLSKHFDIFVQDAFSILHRNQASIVGFPKVLPSYIGRILEEELIALTILKKVKNAVYVLGGAKPSDHIDLLKHVLKGRVRVLTTGVLGEAFLIAKGVDIGKKKKYLKDLGALAVIPDLKSLLKKHANKIETPVDFAIRKKGKRIEINLNDLPSNEYMFDIGKKTINNYKKIIENSRAVFMKGTPGKYLEKEFLLGTKELLKATSKAKFSFIGGGDTTTALEIIKLNKKSFSYCSLSGGALLNYLAGNKLPGLEVLYK